MRFHLRAGQDRDSYDIFVPEERMAKMIAHLLIIIFLCLTARCADICPRGYFLYTPVTGSDICHPCIGDSFMPEERHTQRICYGCSYVHNPSVERVVSACNRTHDTEILCAEDYFRSPSKPPNVRGKCNKCTECNHPVRKCSGYQDTVCCSGKNYGAGLDAEGNFVCVRQCRQGEYLNGSSDVCQPCPAGTYMPTDNHTSTQCEVCAEPASRVEIVLSPCTSKRPAVIGCVPGYYRARMGSYLGGQDTCIRCTDCFYEGGDNQYTGRQCDTFKDTVCCPHPNMTVQDTETGPSCGENAPLAMINKYPVTCGVDQYLYTDQRSGFRACLTCPQGTYMNIKDHKNRSCMECANFPDSQRYSTCQVRAPIPHEPLNDVNLKSILAVNIATTCSLLFCLVMLTLMALTLKTLKTERKGQKVTMDDLNAQPFEPSEA